MTQLAFVNTPVSHANFLTSMRAHREADRIVSGAYWKRGRGCAIGCGIQSVMALTGRPIAADDHAALAEATGTPLVSQHLLDRIFEGLPKDEQRDFPVAFAEAIVTGMDLSGVWPRFAVRMLREIVLPVAGTSAAAVVERIARGYETDWRHDSPAAAQKAAWTAVETSVARVAAAVAAAVAWTAVAARPMAYSAMAAILLDEIRASPVVPLEDRT